MPHWIGHIIQRYPEKLSYLIAGGLTSLVSWGTYAGFVTLGCGINASNVLSWVLAVIFAYLTNKVFVFRARGWGARQVCAEFVAFVSGRLVTGAIELGSVPVLLWLGVTQSLFQIEGFWAKFIAGLLPLVLNYIIGKRAVFREKRSAEHD